VFCSSNRDWEGDMAAVFTNNLEKNEVIALPCKPTILEV